MEAFPNSGDDSLFKRNNRTIKESVSKGTSAKYKRIYFTMLGEKQLAT